MKEQEIIQALRNKEIKRFEAIGHWDCSELWILFKDGRYEPFEDFDYPDGYPMICKDWMDVSMYVEDIYGCAFGQHQSNVLLQEDMPFDVVHAKDDELAYNGDYLYCYIDVDVPKKTKKKDDAPAVLYFKF